MPKQSFHGGIHKHYYSPPSQQELNLESKEVCTFRIAPKLHEYIKKRADENGVATSKYIESRNFILFHGLHLRKIKHLSNIGYREMEQKNNN